jgi:SPP1 family predicted phage head-tail adaptor
MNEVLTLIKGETSRTVFYRVASIGQKEFYEASARDFYPEMKFILADYLEYNSEQLVEYNGQMYNVLRTFRAGQELEIVVTRASAEEGGIYG